MLTTVNATKWMILILTSIWIQIEVIQIKGHWIAGGNVVFPFLVAILLWYASSRIKEFKGLVKGEKFFKGEKLCL